MRTTITQRIEFASDCLAKLRANAEQNRHLTRAAIGHLLGIWILVNETRGEANPVVLRDLAEDWRRIMRMVACDYRIDRAPLFQWPLTESAFDAWDHLRFVADEAAGKSRSPEPPRQYITVFGGDPATWYVGAKPKPGPGRPRKNAERNAAIYNRRVVDGADRQTVADEFEISVDYVTVICGRERKLRKDKQKPR